MLVSHRKYQWVYSVTWCSWPTAYTFFRGCPMLKSSSASVNASDQHSLAKWRGHNSCHALPCPDLRIHCAWSLSLLFRPCPEGHSGNAASHLQDGAYLTAATGGDSSAVKEQLLHVWEWHCFVRIFYPQKVHKLLEISSFMLFYSKFPGVFYS